MKRVLLCCFSMLLMLTLLCACGEPQTDYGLRRPVQTFDAEGNETGYFDFVYSGKTIVGINRCDKDGNVLLYGGDVTIDASGNVTRVVFRHEDDTPEETYCWKFPDGISPHAINFYENLVDTYFDQQTADVPPGLSTGFIGRNVNVITSPDSSDEDTDAAASADTEDDASDMHKEFYLQLPGGSAIPDFGLSFDNTPRSLSISSDMAFCAPLDRIDLSVCVDSIPQTAFDVMVPCDIAAVDIDENSYVMSVADGTGRVTVLHRFSSYSLQTVSEYTLFTYDESGRVTEIRVASSRETTIIEAAVTTTYARVVPAYAEDGTLLSAKAYTKTDRLMGEAVFGGGVLSESTFFNEEGGKVLYSYKNGSLVRTTEYDKNGNVTFDEDYTENTEG